MRNFETDPLRVAMLGYIPDNQHPYSWSAIINGFDSRAMVRCPAPQIGRYLNAQSPGSVGIPFAKVTHLWTDDFSDANEIAEAALIPNIVARPEDVLGKVDAVIIATDDSEEHVQRVKPFAAAGIPIFIDKPLATTPGDLAQFIAWKRQGIPIVSSSGFRYALELTSLRDKSWRWLTGTTCKNWQRYGIHVLEPIYTITGPGYARIRATRTGSTFLMEAEHQDGTLVSLAAIKEGFGSAFVLHGYGDDQHTVVQIKDNYSAFRAQLMAFLEFATGRRPEPYPFAQTVELMTILMAAERSAELGGRDIDPRFLLLEIENSWNFEGRPSAVTSHQDEAIFNNEPISAPR